jgi:hypothetical protein
VFPILNDDANLPVSVGGICPLPPHHHHCLKVTGA